MFWNQQEGAKIYEKELPPPPADSFLPDDFPASAVQCKPGICCSKGKCEKHQNLTLWNCKPILVLDMWEHSYFLQYKANRGEYIKAFWNIINWNNVNKRFKNVRQRII